LAFGGFRPEIYLLLWGLGAVVAGRALLARDTRETAGIFESLQARTPTPPIFRHLRQKHPVGQRAAPYTRLNMPSHLSVL